uniref:Uncharacterized protein n=2 Tax=Auxenochlorella protothecoides TaxID=3075 RepID=A0A1D2A7B2_AUXPR
MTSAVETCVLANALPSSLLQRIQSDAKALAASPNYWFPLECLDSPATAAEEAAAHLYHTYIAAKDVEGVVGAEYWVQAGSLAPGKTAAVLKTLGIPYSPEGCRLHHPLHPNIPDNRYLRRDEVSAFTWTRYFVSIVGLNWRPMMVGREFQEKTPHVDDSPGQEHPPSISLMTVKHSALSQLPSGGLHPQDEHLMANEGRLVTPLISSVLYLTGTAQNPQRQGPTVILDQRFDAELGAVTPPSPAWSTLSFPLAGNYCLFDGALGHGVLDAGDEAEMRATLLINWWQHRPEAVGRAPLMPAQAEAAEGGDAGLGSDARRKLADLCLGERALPIPSIAVDAARLAGEDDMLLPDNLLAENGVALHGPGAVHAVTFHHQGLSLCPIDGGEGLSIAAALVLAQDGESSSESGDEE